MKRLLWLLALLILAPAALAGSVSEDRAALEDLYAATNGESWTDNTNWGTSAPLGDWYGITTDANGRVTRVDLLDNNLQGTLPDSFGDLDAATYINIKQNALTGQLPSTLGSLASAQWLLLSGVPEDPYTNPQHHRHQGKSDESGNTFSGTIPPQIGQLSNLEYLELSGSAIQDTVPPEIGNLKNLKTLMMSWNPGLTGPLPEELGDLESLQKMYFRTSGLTGDLPASLSKLTNMRLIHVGGNQLTGELPDLSGWKDIRTLSLANNEFTGPWPRYLFNGSYKNWGSMSLSWNNFHGQLPDFSNVNDTQIWTFSVTGNYNMDGPIPESITQLRGLILLGLGWNEFSGELPQTGWKDFGRIRNIDVRANQLTGPLPAEIGQMNNIARVWMDGNSFSGEIPEEWGNIQSDRLWEFTLGGNDLEGRIPPGIADYTDTNNLRLASNRFVFADLIPFLAHNPPNNLEYEEQKPYGQMITADLAPGASFSYDYAHKTHPDDDNQWYRDGEPMAGQTSSQLTINAVSESDAGTYTLRKSNAQLPELGTLESQPITLQVSSDGSDEYAGGGDRAAMCGDGIRDETEACDDGNSRDDDWCTNSCQINTRSHSGFSFVDEELDYTQHETTKDLQVRVDDTAVYNTGYYSIDGGKNWQQFSLTGNNARNSWLISHAQANLPFTYDELNTSAQKLVATYSCTWNPDWTCHDNTWQLKTFSAAYSTAPECGNGIIEQGEACDGSNITTTCTEQGYESGTIGCTSSCELDTSACTQEAGTLTATTLQPTRLTSYSAQLNMELTDWGVRDRGEPWLEYREKGASEWIATERREVSYPTPWIHSEIVDGLTPATTYQVRARAFTWERTDAGEIIEFATNTEIGSPETDRAALMALYESTNGDGWDDSTGWGGSADTLGSWHGITTNSGGRVQRVELQANNLAGTIPPEIGELSETTYLQLEQNQLTGPLPPEIGDMRSLTHLYLAGRPDEQPNYQSGGYHPGKVDAVQNQYSGQIPPELGQLTNLEMLRLERQGDMTGPIPAELGDLANLKALLLYGRYNDQESGFSGTPPAELGDLKNLQFLHIGRSALEGPLPEEWGGMESMKSLWFGATKITSFPESFKNLTELRWIGADGSYIDMPFPHFMFEGNQQHMHTFVFGWPELGDEGGFTGTIETVDFRNTPQMNHFGVTGNVRLTGGLPFSLPYVDPEIFNAAWTDRGDVSGYEDTEGLTGQIPDGDYSNWDGLRNLRLNDNHLSGPIPVSLALVDASRLKHFQDNNFVFADIIPALEAHESNNVQGDFGYSSQYPFGNEASHSVAAGSSITLDDFETIVTHPDNEYQWHKDGSAISGATSRELQISNADSGDTGTYWLEVQNDRAPALTLESERLDLIVN